MKTFEKAKRTARMRRHHRVRAKISGTAEVPRLSVYRSNKGFYIQIIDDVERKTIASVSSKEIKGGKKMDAAKEGGKLIAKKALEKKVNKVVFDRSGYRYHGRVRAVADGAREGGLMF